MCSRFKVPGKVDGGRLAGPGQGRACQALILPGGPGSQTHWVRSPDRCSGKVTLSGLCSQSHRRGVSLAWLLRPLSTQRTG